MTIPQITLAGKQVGKVGFGLMQLTFAGPPIPQEQALEAIKAATDAGATAWSTALFYGEQGKRLDNIKLIAAFFNKYPEYKDKVVIVVKGGVSDDFSMTADIDLFRSQLKEAKEILGDKDIDVASYARIPLDSSAEETARNLVKLREEGLFHEFGTSETNAESLEIIHKIAPVSVVEIEVSLWSWEKEIRDVVEWSKKNQVPIFAYSPLCRGFITRKWKTPEDIPAGSFHAITPRFQGAAFYHNLKLVDALDEIAAKKGVTTAQLAIAWVAQINPYNIPIPGSVNPERARTNTEAASVVLTDDELKSINDILDTFEVIGGKYPPQLTALQMR